MLTRREALGALLAAATGKAPLIDTHIHLFDSDRFPYHPGATYRPPAERLDEYGPFVKAAGIAHAVIVHPEPYQDDHRYLEYCFAHEPSPGFFKGTCLFDPIAPATPRRMSELVKRHPGRIVALRIHETGERGEAPLAAGPIKNRDLRSPHMLDTWKAAQDLGLFIQVHMAPYFAPAVGELAAALPRLTVIIDHLGRAGEGTPADAEAVINLGRLPNVLMKYSTASASSQQYVQRLYGAFGPDRMIWGGLGMNPKAFALQTERFNQAFAFAGEADRAKVRGLTARRLFRFAGA